MILGKDDSVVGLMSFLSFAFSVIAAVLAIDMYALLRTGQFGKTWRVLIITAVMFALMQALRLAELLNFQTFRGYHLSEVVELMFVMSLAYAFYLQRSVFIGNDKKSAERQATTLTPPVQKLPDTRADEWAHLTGHYEGPLPTPDRARPLETFRSDQRQAEDSAPESLALEGQSPVSSSQPRIAS